MLNYRDVLFSLDGAINSVAALTAFTPDPEDPVRKGLLGIYASLETTRTLIEDQVATEQPAEGVCSHPEDKITLRHAGKSTIRLCGLCNEIVE